MEQQSIKLAKDRRYRLLLSPMLPPQQVKNWEYTDKCDVYAIGCIFFEMLTGKTPQDAKCTLGFNKMNVEKLQNKLTERNVPEEMINFIK